ncbi:hypothetical protein C0J52_08975 [Blattella germanica]|nr:hypothetical protein C0J52_08975 [Blattella germanica]
MKSLEEFLEEMEKNLSAMGMPIEKAKLKNYLLKPGVERLNLVQWALSQIGVVVKDEKGELFLLIQPLHNCGYTAEVVRQSSNIALPFFLTLPDNQSMICFSTWFKYGISLEIQEMVTLDMYEDVPMIICEFGICDSCSDVDSIKFWKKLFGIVHAYKEVNQEAVRNSYKKNEKFCLNLSSSSTLKQILQPTNTNTKIPLQVQRRSDKIVSREELMKLHLDVCNELKELDQEKEQWQKEGDVALVCSWMSSKVDNSSGTEHEKLRKLIMDLNERVEKVNLVRHFCFGISKLTVIYVMRKW